MNNETKKGRGGARPNSGMKASGIETITVRIDKRLLNAVTTIKDEFKAGKSLDDIISKPTAKNDDAKLLKKIAKLEREKDEIRDDLFKILDSHKQDHKAEIKKLDFFHKTEVEHLEQQIKRLERSNKILEEYVNANDLKNGNLDEKLRKRLIQALHPDKFQDAKAKAVNGELVKELNGLAK
jgi:hypothetical protein